MATLLVVLLSLFAAVQSRSVNQRRLRDQQSDAVSDLQLLVPVALKDNSEPFSNIPAYAFQLDQGHSYKKDLSNPSQRKKSRKQTPKELVNLCLNYFKGQSHRRNTPEEVLVHLCTEVLNLIGIKELKSPIEHVRIEFHVDEDDKADFVKTLTENVNKAKGSNLNMLKPDFKYRSTKFMNSKSTNDGLKNVNFFNLKEVNNNKNAKDKVEYVNIDDGNFWLNSLAKSKGKAEESKARDDVKIWLINRDDDQDVGDIRNVRDVILNDDEEDPAKVLAWKIALELVSGVLPNLDFDNQDKVVYLSSAPSNENVFVDDNEQPTIII